LVNPVSFSIGDTLWSIINASVAPCVLVIQQNTSETVMISVLGFPSEPLDTKTTKSRSDWMIQGSWSVTDDASPNGTPEYWMKSVAGKTNSAWPY
jgi:hypothetical protein